MRSKAVIVAVALIGLFSCGVAFALPSEAESNTTQMTKLFPEAWSIPYVNVLGFGVFADYVVDKTLDDGSDLSDTHTAGGKISYDPMENIHLNVSAGVSQMTIGSVPVSGSVSDLVELKTEDNLAVGGGGKVDITEFPFPVVQGLPNLKLFATGSYRHYRAAVDQIVSGFSVRHFDLDVEISEWQSTLGVSQRWENPLGTGLSFIAVPYVGVQYNDGNFKISGSSSLPDRTENTASVKTGIRESDDVVGVVTGLQLLTFNQTFTVNVEGRFVTEEAGTVTGHFRW